MIPPFPKTSTDNNSAHLREDEKYRGKGTRTNLVRLDRKLGLVAVGGVSIARLAVLRYLQSAVFFVRFPPVKRD